MVSLKFIIEQMEINKVHQQFLSAGELNEIELKIGETLRSILSSEIIAKNDANDLIEFAYYCVKMTVICAGFQEQIYNMLNQTIISDRGIQGIKRVLHFNDDENNKYLYYGFDGLFEENPMIFSKKGKSLFEEGGYVPKSTISMVVKDYVYQSYFSAIIQRFYSKLEKELEGIKIINIETEIDLEIYFRQNGQYCKRDLLKYTSVYNAALCRNISNGIVNREVLLSAISVFADLCSNFCHINLSKEVVSEVEGLYGQIFGGMLNA